MHLERQAMVFTPTKSTSHAFTDEHVASAAGAAQQLEHTFDIDATWEGEKSRIILDYYRNILIDFAIYSPSKCEILYNALLRADSLSDLYLIESPLIGTSERRSSEEKRFLKSWLGLYELPLPHNGFKMPEIRSNPYGTFIKFVKNSFQRSFDPYFC